MSGNLKSTLSVNQDISQVNEFNTRNNFTFPRIQVLFCSLYKHLALLRRKNTAINSNTFHDNQHMLDYHELSHVRLPILLVSEISIKHSFIIIKREECPWNEHNFQFWYAQVAVIHKLITIHVSRWLNKLSDTQHLRSFAHLFSTKLHNRIYKLKYKKLVVLLVCSHVGHS